MSKLKFDLAQQGLRCVLKPYQIEIMHHFWYMQKPMDSRTVHNYLLSIEVEGARSRASVISFLNWMVNEGFLDYETRTTKGGHKRTYRLIYEVGTEKAFKAYVARMFQEGAEEFWEQEEG